MAYGYNQLTENLLNSLCNSNYGNKREIISVNGLQEAKNFILNRGENIILRDSNDDVIYVKACDELGKYSLKVYQCSDVTEKVLSECQKETVSRSDFDKLSKDMEELKKLIQGVSDEHNVKQSANRNINVKQNSTVQ